MLETILVSIFIITFSAMCAVFCVSIGFSIAEDIKQSKRNDARELREIEYHKKRMKEFR